MPADAEKTASVGFLIFGEQAVFASIPIKSPYLHRKNYPRTVKKNNTQQEKAGQLCKNGVSLYKWRYQPKERVKKKRDCFGIRRHLPSQRYSGDLSLPAKNSRRPTSERLGSAYFQLLRTKRFIFLSKPPCFKFHR